MATEKRMIDAYLDGEIPKIKTPFAEIIVSGTTEKPYYNIVFFDPECWEYEVCFGSYYLENVRKWLSEEFEIVDTPTVDAVEVVRCKNCQYWNPRYETMGMCMKHNSIVTFTKPDFFCAWGKDKNDGICEKG